MVKSALIGHSGFVGSTLKNQRSFTHYYNSQNINEISGEKFDLVVCAATPAAKWIANRNPEADRATIALLCACLAEIRADTFVLISTIDVYPQALGQDEDAPIIRDELAAYGRHRFDLETMVSSTFTGALIMRLPALFGRGLKKNALYDLIHNNNIHLLDGAATFQFYNLAHLSADIERCRAQQITRININSAPISLQEIAASAFGYSLPTQLNAHHPCYDIRSKYSSLWDGYGGYLYDKLRTLDEISEFVRATRHLLGSRCQ